MTRFSDEEVDSGDDRAGPVCHPHLTARGMAEVGQQQAGAGLADGLAQGIALAQPPCRTHALAGGPRELCDEGDDLVELHPALRQARSAATTAGTRPFPQGDLGEGCGQGDRAASADLHDVECSVSRVNAQRTLPSHPANLPRDVDNPQGDTVQWQTVNGQRALVSGCFVGVAAGAKYRPGPQVEPLLGCCRGPVGGDDVGATAHSVQHVRSDERGECVGVDVCARDVLGREDAAVGGRDGEESIGHGSIVPGRAGPHDLSTGCHWDDGEGGPWRGYFSAADEDLRRNWDRAGCRARPSRNRRTCRAGSLTR